MASRISRTVVRLARGLPPALRQTPTISSLTQAHRLQRHQQWFFSSLHSSTTRQPVALMSTATPKSKPKRVNITFVDRDGDEHIVQAKPGDTLLEVAKEFDIDLEGACEGTLSCSTCHLIVDPEWFDKIPDPLTEEEQDMLDLAYGLTDTSRLGCQILVSEDLEGIKLTVPSGTRDARDT